ncbi:hypothetical protein H4R26_003386 [Coemansia thaxteri]|uniref:YbaK/aminoacyl-tRNA synthetase-associated domain-containing protein n=1 Tax=Coemansia thaxteri TaxID=2663907 RepID=A0A9W8BGX6_9FUNG|nr:hypothetical protein H4R26_003386 [Coemansia thaxteri]
MENKRWRPIDPPQSKYYCVLVQYTQSIDTGAMADFVRSTIMDQTTARKHFNYRLVAAEVSLELTGFGNNAVCPIGLAHPLALIVCQSIAKLQPPVFWLGGGHVDYKLAVPVDRFIQATGCHVADISH